MDLSRARPSLTPSPFVPSSDIIGAATFYVTDGVTVLSEAGPWPVAPRDIFINPALTAIQTEPWHAAERTVCHWPASSFGAYVGSINPDASGKLNWHARPGPSRRCDVWSAINQEDIELQVCDGVDNQSINWSQGNWHPTTPNSSATFIVGLPKLVRSIYDHTIYTLADHGSAWGITAIGWGAQFGTPTPWVWPSMTGMPPGKYGQTGIDTSINPVGGTPGQSIQYQLGPSNGALAHHSVAGFMGVQSVFPLIIANTVIGANSFSLFCGKNEPAEWIMRVGYRG